MNKFEDASIQLLMDLKTSVEELGYLPKECTLQLIQNFAEVVLKSQDLVNLLHSEGNPDYHERVFH